MMGPHCPDSESHPCALSSCQSNPAGRRELTAGAYCYYKLLRKNVTYFSRFGLFDARRSQADSDANHENILRSYQTTY